MSSVEPFGLVIVAVMVFPDWIVAVLVTLTAELSLRFAVNVTDTASLPEVGIYWVSDSFGSSVNPARSPVGLLNRTDTAASASLTVLSLASVLECLGPPLLPPPPIARAGLTARLRNRIDNRVVLMTVLQKKSYRWQSVAPPKGLGKSRHDDVARGASAKCPHDRAFDRC